MIVFNIKKLGKLTRNEKVACSNHVTSSKKDPRNRLVSGIFLYFANFLGEFEIAVL